MNASKTKRNVRIFRRFWRWELGFVAFGEQHAFYYSLVCILFSFNSSLKKDAFSHSVCSSPVAQESMRELSLPTHALIVRLFRKVRGCEMPGCDSLPLPPSLRLPSSSCRWANTTGLISQVEILQKQVSTIGKQSTPWISSESIVKAVVLICQHILISFTRCYFRDGTLLNGCAWRREAADHGQSSTMGLPQ